MRIALVSPLIESVPPKTYGGTERVVSYLCEELVQMGHEVTLFASGDSVTQARLEAICPRALRLDKTVTDPLAYQTILLDRVFEQSGSFDLIHFHIDYFHFPVARRLRTPHVTTLHGRLDLADLVEVYKNFPEMPVVSISDSQRRPLPHLNWKGTVYHGLPNGLYNFSPQPDPYLVFIGRMSPEKRVDRAIEIAKRAKMKLRIAAKFDPKEDATYVAQIKELIKDPIVEYLGEIGEKEKDSLLGKATALLFPIDWPEPFGMVMIEAMACGTPIIAYSNGSVPEVIDEGVTGLIVNGIDAGVKAVEKARQMDRRRIRDVFERRFTANRMARDYVTVYESLARKEMSWETVSV